MVVEAPYLNSVKTFEQQLITVSKQYKNERALKDTLRKLVYGYGVW